MRSISAMADELRDWRIVPRAALGGDSHNLIEVKTSSPATHARLRIFPDGGVARLRLYGDVVADWNRLRLQGDVDLAAVEHGGLVVACSDMFFGSRHNLDHAGRGDAHGRRMGNADGAADPGTIGASSGLERAGRCAASKSTRASSKETRQARCSLEGIR